MGGCMSTPEAPKKAQESKQTSSSATASSKSKPPAQTTSANSGLSPTQPAHPAEAGTPNSAAGVVGNGGAAGGAGVGAAGGSQGLAAALAETEPAAPDARGNRDRSNQIDRQLEDDQRKFRKECKILLLGSGESGKSTIVKQMKIIHQNGYSKDELLTFRGIVHKNVLDSAQALIMAMRKIGVDPEDANNRAYADRILEYRIDADPSSTIPSEILFNIESLWHDPVIPAVMDRSSEFYLMDSATYFFANIRKIAAPDYVPDEADVLRARTKTTGISETRFNMGQLSIHMFDVGGQRSERKKWIHCFEAVTSIIFCVALSEYDQVLLEESGQNRMQESLVLFESVINSRWFLRTSVILFLNKIDLFKQKLPKVPLVNYFPEYTGGADINKAAKYILWRFTQTNRARLSVYPHLTQATDTSNIRLVFAAVKETILQNALRDSGIL
ncbi:guanine nucleotide-binding protein subunit alpha [Cryptococcus amylolentus CBS 6039]|uniref:Guanine nucleotide-binding protein subunit alpha n=2 Tax=Cryptococcus amylolentus TaxID=104669 RepID=A0A1E3H8T7_9TREE|nr:guanine nucleotide-binding protein subunit alpha [Cryptococcus amylolentus CBS 6039]ODN72747.1 guanine nucleotide-binding protein subunit alpha [Cryptococcus amylolentus CBS 6039]ODN97952.1 guanine nucleotide-binding protein subunit alpha [Cryptococcus amylolentus CBS 6273]